MVFSFMSGTIHSYCTVAMAPGLAVTVAAGASILWRHRAELAARLVLALVVAGTGVTEQGRVLRGPDQQLPVDLYRMVHRPLVQPPRVRVGYPPQPGPHGRHRAGQRRGDGPESGATSFGGQRRTDDL